MKAEVPLSAVSAVIDGEDVVNGLDNNDENILAFIVEMLLAAESVELVNRLQARLIEWWEPGGDGHKEGQ